VVRERSVSLFIEMSDLREVRVFWQVMYKIVILEIVNLPRLEANQWI